MPGPYGQMLKAQSKVARIAKSAEKKHLGSAAQQAAKALGGANNSALWITASAIDAPAYGTNVFTDSITALNDLNHVPAVSFPGRASTIKLIVKALRAVAADAISQATGASQKLLETATGDMSSGDHAARPAAALAAYQKAWEKAMQAIARIASGAVTSIPLADLTAAAQNALGSKVIALAGPMIQKHPTPLTSGGKPEVFFGGAEGCPFCAVQRWGMIAGLSQFGTFSNLHLMQSDTTEFPIVSTFTFFGSSYHSSVISFVPVEILSNVRSGLTGYQHLQPRSPAQRALMQHFDGSGQTPFIDVGGRYIQNGSTVQPPLLNGLTWTQVANALTDPNSIPAQVVAGEAEVLTAEICGVTGGKPQSVCSQPVVQQYEAALPRLDGLGGGCPTTAADVRDVEHRNQGPVARASRCGG